MEGMRILRRTIWTLWLQGRSLAPPVIQHCIASWERLNPTWEVRVLDAGTVGRYVDVGDVVDLDHQAVTAASLSAIVRLLLLRGYGAVWSTPRSCAPGPSTTGSIPVR